MLSAQRAFAIAAAMTVALMITSVSEYWLNGHPDSKKKSEGPVVNTAPNHLSTTLIILAGLGLVASLLVLIALVIDVHTSNHLISHFLHWLQAHTSRLSNERYFDQEWQQREEDRERLDEDDAESDATESTEGTFGPEDSDITEDPHPQPPIRPRTQRMRRHYPILGAPRQTEPVINLAWLHERNIVVQPRPATNQPLPTIEHTLRRTERVADFTALRREALSNCVTLLAPSHNIFRSPHIILDCSDYGNSSESSSTGDDEEELAVDSESDD